jgi:phenylpropionate dioxygenase-like ring-hydroxylating dioxygenase large terminal subunit
VWWALTGAGWSYDFDGTLRAPLRPQSLPDLDGVAYGLKPIELEIWQGFVFVRFQPGDQPSVAEIMAPFQDEAAGYHTDAMVPAYRKLGQQEMAVNWKSVRDVDNEGYHVPIAHPALQEPVLRGIQRRAGAAVERAPLQEDPAGDG